MCDSCEVNIKHYLLSKDLTDEEKIEAIGSEVDKEALLDWLDDVGVLGVTLVALGITLGDVEKAYGYPVNSDDIRETQRGADVKADTTKSNPRLIKLYKYTSKRYGASGVGSNTRRFCRTMVTRTNLSLMRKEDIERLNSSNPGFGKGGSNTYSIFDWRGGVNCYHEWTKYFYDPQTRNLVKAPNNEQPRQRTAGGRVPYANGTNKPS